MDFTFIIFLLITLAHYVISTCDPNKHLSVEHKLREEILCNYDPSIVPVKTPSDKINVTSHFYLRHIDFIEETNILHAYMLIGLEWNDAFLKWDSKSTNITYMNIPSHLFWMPDLANYRSYQSSGGLVPMDALPTTVSSEGEVFYFNNVEMPAQCNVNLAHWPHDSHECTFFLSSRSYYSDTVEFQTLDNWTFQLGEEYFENNVWDVNALNARVSHKYFGENKTYRLASIILTINIQRHSTTLFSTVTSPIAVLVLMLLSTFWIHPNEMYRVYFLIISFAGQFTYLNYLGTVIPPNGSEPIVIVSFLRNSLILNWFAFLAHLTTRNRIRTEQPTPEWLMKFSTRVLASDVRKFLVLTEDFQELKTDDEINLVAEKARNMEWTLLATLIDRLCFILYLTSYIVMLIILIA